MAAERRTAAGKAGAPVWTAVLLAIPMGTTLALYYAGELAGIPATSPLAFLAAGAAALVMGAALVRVEKIRTAAATGIVRND